MKRVRIIVRGIVQGVGFRWATEREAARLRVCGYVRNLPSGAVEILVEGSAEAVDRLIAWAKQGPPGARVEGVDVTFEEPTAEFGGFCIRH